MLLKIVATVLLATHAFGSIMRLDRMPMPVVPGATPALFKAVLLGIVVLVFGLYGILAGAIWL